MTQIPEEQKQKTKNAAVLSQAWKALETFPEIKTCSQSEAMADEVEDCWLDRRSEDNIWVWGFTAMQKKPLRKWCKNLRINCCCFFAKCETF